MIGLDTRISGRMRIADRPSLLRSIAAIMAHSGDSWFWLVGLGLLWWQGTDYWKIRAAILIIAILLTALLVFLVKFTVRRRRPAGEWGKLYRTTDPHSFPSGHAVRAVMLAVIMVGLGPLWFGLLLTAWAPLVGLARVAMGVHYLSDVVFGWILGLMVGGLILLVF